MNITNPDILFVAGAASKDDETRRFMTGVHIADGKMYATDAHRLHWCNTALPEGDYKIIKLLKRSLHIEPADMGTFPNYERVIPTDLEKSDTFYFGYQHASNHYIDACRLIKWLPDDKAINLDYLSALYGQGWEVSLAVRHNSIIAHGGTRHAVIALMEII